MAPYDQFEREVKKLIRQGYSLHDAFIKAKKNYAYSADQADKLLKIKQKIAREMNNL
jgi:hypothetical protein